MYDKNKVIKLMEDNISICKSIYNGEDNKAFSENKETINKNNIVFTKFIEMTPKLQQLGVDIPMDVILQQLRNLVDAFEYRDSMLLVDTLKYEINDSLQLYLEILEQLEKENIVL